jgi:hypothetical protein
MATYNDKTTAKPYTGKNVGVVIGVKHEGVSLGTQSGTDNKDFVFTPATYGPAYPYKSYAKDFKATKEDMTVYDDGVAGTISTWTEATGTASLSSAPADKSVMTGDIVEQRELFIAQKLSIKPKRETSDLYQLRVAGKRKTSDDTEWTLTIDYKTASEDLAKLIFEPVTGHAGRYTYPEEPPQLYAAVIVERTVSGVTTIEKIYYCEDLDADFDTLLDVTAGKDAVQTNFVMTSPTSPTMVIPSEVS